MIVEGKRHAMMVEGKRTDLQTSASRKQGSTSTTSSAYTISAGCCNELYVRTGGSMCIQNTNIPS